MNNTKKSRNIVYIFKKCVNFPRYLIVEISSVIWPFSVQIGYVHLTLWFSSVQSLSHVRLCNAMNRSMPGLPVHHQLPEFIQTRVHWVSDAIQPPHPLSSPSPPVLWVFSNESALLIRWQKYWSFSFNISPSNEHTRLISFRMDWSDLLAVHGTIKNFLNTIVQKHQFFSAQLSL